MRIATKDKHNKKSICDLPAEGYENTDMFKEWVANVLAPFQPVGYGVNFAADMTEGSQDNEYAKKIRNEGKIDIGSFTVLWVEPDKMYLILHDPSGFCDAQ